ncbi:hypothetical protein RJ639_002926 [Escallonia herrerae]|uniref:Sm protein E n=1 Tax=Escallonia herrerae TaxID=1293975 RepID=A0AA88W2T3_9ASTE|nr:hypothetical protein RJ639_002926 [Escallonia herrerae]
MASTKVQRIMTQPIGFHEYMNLVLDDAEEVSTKKRSRKQLGRILLKGDNITLMMNTYGEIGRAAAVHRGTAFSIIAQPVEAEVSIRALP